MKNFKEIIKSKETFWEYMIARGFLTTEEEIELMESGAPELIEDVLKLYEERSTDLCEEAQKILDDTKQA